MRKRTHTMTSRASGKAGQNASNTTRTTRKVTMFDSIDIQRAADWIRNADGIVIAAGAGMSVDSGLPDFRGADGLWTSLLPAGMTERDVGSLTQGDCFVDKPA